MLVLGAFEVIGARLQIQDGDQKVDLLGNEPVKHPARVVHERGVVDQEEETAGLSQVGYGVHDEFETKSHKA